MFRDKPTITAFLLGIALLGAAVAPAAAAPGDESFFANLATNGDQGEDGVAADAMAEVAGITGRIARAQSAADIPFWGEDGAEANATTYARDATKVFSSHNETIATIANANIGADTKHDVFAVHFHDREGGNVTRYVVVDVVDGEYQNAQALTPEEFNATGRTQDHYLSLDWYASKNADDELKQFVDKYEDDPNISRTYGAKLYAQYASGIDSDLLGDA